MWLLKEMNKIASSTGTEINQMYNEINCMMQYDIYSRAKL